MEIDRNAIERPHGIHAQQERRFVLKIELIEDMRVGECNREIVEIYPADFQLF